MCRKKHPGVNIPTCLVKVKHLPKCTCVIFYTQVWLLPNIFVKSQTCVKITMSVPNILTWFFEGNKDSLIRSCSFSHNFGLFTFPFFKCCPHILSFFVSCVKNKHFHFPPQQSDGYPALWRTFHNHEFVENQLLFITWVPVLWQQLYWLN